MNEVKVGSASLRAPRSSLMSVQKSAGTRNAPVASNQTMAVFPSVTVTEAAPPTTSTLRLDSVTFARFVHSKAVALVAGCSRVVAGAPPIPTSIGWLLPFHGATAIEGSNVHSMGWCALDLKKPETVLYVSDAPALTPKAPYEIEYGEIPEVDPASFKTGIRVVFPQGIVEKGDDLLVYYGAADVSVAAERVRKRDLVASLAEAVKLKQGGVP